MAFTLKNDHKHKERPKNWSILKNKRDVATEGYAWCGIPFAIKVLEQVAKSELGL